MILLKAQRKFPFQTQTLELCKHVIGQMTPIFVDKVRAGKIKASAVQRELGGGMFDLLRSILIRNAGSSSLGGLSDEADRLFQEIQVSDEWLNVAEAVENADADRLRTDAKQPPPSPVENNGKTSQMMEIGATAADSPEKLSHAEKNSKTVEGADSGATNRSALVKAYIDEVFEKTGRRITKKEIWSKAGDKSRTEFERWEREDPKRPNRAANDRFTRLLTVQKPHLM